MLYPPSTSHSAHARRVPPAAAGGFEYVDLTDNNCGHMGCSYLSISLYIYNGLMGSKETEPTISHLALAGRPLKLSVDWGHDLGCFLA